MGSIRGRRIYPPQLNTYLPCPVSLLCVAGFRGIPPRLNSPISLDNGTTFEEDRFDGQHYPGWDQRSMEWSKQ